MGNGRYIQVRRLSWVQKSHKEDALRSVIVAERLEGGDQITLLHTGEDTKDLGLSCGMEVGTSTIAALRRIKVIEEYLKI